MVSITEEEEKQIKNTKETKQKGSDIKIKINSCTGCVNRGVQHAKQEK